MALIVFIEQTGSKLIVDDDGFLNWFPDVHTERSHFQNGSCRFLVFFSNARYFYFRITKCDNVGFNQNHPIAVLVFKTTPQIQFFSIYCLQLSSFQTLSLFYTNVTKSLLYRYVFFHIKPVLLVAIYKVMLSKNV